MSWCSRRFVWLGFDDSGLSGLFRLVCFVAGVRGLVAAKAKGWQGELTTPERNPMRGITCVRQLSRRYRSFCLQIRRLSLRRQLSFRLFILTGPLSLGLAHFSRTNKNFEAGVGSEHREGSAHIELITFGTYRTLATWLPLRTQALLLLTVGVYRLRCNAARTLKQRCSAPPSSTSKKAMQ
jgi:hypothetical protein